MQRDLEEAACGVVASVAVPEDEQKADDSEKTDDKKGFEGGGVPSQFPCPGCCRARYSSYKPQQPAPRSSVNAPSFCRLLPSSCC